MAQQKIQPNQVDTLNQNTTGTASNITGVYAGTITSSQVTTALGYTPGTGNGTVTAVSGTAPVVSSGGTTPAISMAKATGSVDGYLSSTDWTTFNNKGTGNGTVTSVAALTLGTTGTDLSSTVATGTTTPVITLNVPTASASNRGALSAADWTTFNNKGSGTVTAVSVASSNGFAGTSSGGATPALTLSTSITGVLYGNGTSLAASNVTNDAQIKVSDYSAKGKILIGTGSGTFTALTVGSDTQVLTADSTQASGVKWAAAAGGATSWASGSVSAPGWPNTTTAGTGLYTIASTTEIDLAISGQQALSVTGSSSSANAIQIQSTATGVTPVIINVGSDTNGIGLGIAIKGKNASATGNGGPVTITGGTGSGTGTGGAVTISSGTTGGSASAQGNTLTLTTGGNANTKTGSISIITGVGYATGDVNIATGVPSSATQAVGAINITTGTQTGSGLVNAIAITGGNSNSGTNTPYAAGPITITSGDCGGSGGAGGITITGGKNGSNGNAGSISIIAGYTSTSTSAAGSITLTPGYVSGNTTGGAGGVTISAPTANANKTSAGTGGSGSNITINTSAGTNNTTASGTTQGGIGGSLTSTMGAGGTATGASATGTGGLGGSWAVTLGNGGNGTTTGGAGGTFSITAGNAGTGGNAAAGNFLFTGGTATGTGALSTFGITSAQLTINTAGKGISVKEGSNAKQGLATLVAGTVVVSTTAVTANSRIFLTPQETGLFTGSLRVSARVAGTSFTILSTALTDTCTVAWEIFEPA